MWHTYYYYYYYYTYDKLITWHKLKKSNYATFMTQIMTLINNSCVISKASLLFLSIQKIHNCNDLVLSSKKLLDIIYNCNDAQVNVY